MNMGNGRVTSKSVLLLRSAKEGTDTDPYVQALERDGFKASNLPVLSFSFCGLDELSEALSSPHQYQGIILTSPRAVQAVTKATEGVSEWLQRCKSLWKAKPAFVVGQATAEAASAAGFCPQGEDSGNAEALFSVIAKESTSEKLPLLFPCGNLRRETIPAKLNEIGILFESITVYETGPDPEFCDNLKRYIDNKGIPEYIVYFSPSGVALTKSILTDLNLPLDAMKFVSIGPATTAALVEHNFKVATEASKPNPSHLVESIASTLTPAS